MNVDPIPAEDAVTLTPTQLARAMDISVGYASQLLSGVRGASYWMLCQIYRKTGVRIDKIVGATDAEIDVLEKFANIDKIASEALAARKAAAKSENPQSM
jgi:transcriptional regulator with XRE-family HTH domain